MHVKWAVHIWHMDNTTAVFADYCWILHQWRAVSLKLESAKGEMCEEMKVIIHKSY